MSVERSQYDKLIERIDKNSYDFPTKIILKIDTNDILGWRNGYSDGDFDNNGNVDYFSFNSSNVTLI